MAADEFASAGEALGVVQSAMGYLAGVEYADMPGEVQAEVLRVMEHVDAVQAAVRGRAVSAFTAALTYHQYAVRGMPRWFVTQTKVTKAAGSAHKAWARRADQHPGVIDALVEGVLSESWARAVCAWTDKLPEGCEQDADAILVAAARMGADLEGLARIAAEIAARLAPPDEDEGKLADRSLRLSLTFDGAGVLTGELSPDCAVVVRTVLDALAGPGGDDDDRSHPERYHDALHEAMKRLLTAGGLAGKGGKPLTALVHISLADLMARDPDSALQAQWIARTRALWAAERGGACVVAGDGGAWLEGPAAAAAACDAALIPVVTGDPDITVLDDLVQLCAEYHRLRDKDTDPGKSGTAGPGADRGAHAARMAELERAIIGKAAALMAGPAGLAGFLRRATLRGSLAGPSLPLDVGDTDHIPPQIRRAVAVRDRHCVFPGGCDQPACRCEPHHTEPRAQHGPTRVDKMAQLCWWHHHVVIHGWGWTVTVNRDGTMTARKPDGTIFQPGQRPPPRPG
ncbi:MAG: DUF222 domain-containing protein [Streptosporangiaceae bacterium]|nr:DUF222 domain-containing protein [Streptosporangiaceae bacterium]